MSPVAPDPSVDPSKQALPSHNPCDTTKDSASEDAESFAPSMVPFSLGSRSISAQKSCQYYSLASVSVNAVDNVQHKKISLFSDPRDSQIQLVYDGRSREPNCKESWVSVGPTFDRTALEKLGPFCIEKLNQNDPGTEGSQGYIHFKGGGTLRYAMPESVIVWGNPRLKPEETGEWSLNVVSPIE